ncbi:hypothetical protein ACWEHA_19995, partial [Amycolatopsis nivea]
RKAVKGSLRESDSLKEPFTDFQRLVELVGFVSEEDSLGVNEVLPPVELLPEELGGGLSGGDEGLLGGVEGVVDGVELLGGFGVVGWLVGGSLRSDVVPGTGCPPPGCPPG